MNGEHLQWLDNVLGEASQLSEVKHIIVQGHFPVLFPVKKTKSSGMYMDQHEDSDFWQVLRKHPVDIYFAGECHLNTVSKDSQSDIIQVVSRGNFFSNFLAIDISDDTVDITSYAEVGSEKTMSNFNYVASGHLRILKEQGSKSISTTGELSFFDADDPMLYFNFQRIASLEDRPVLGLGELPGTRRAPIVTDVTVGDSTCSDALINAGAFGQDYDAQSTNVALTSGVYGTAGVFTEDSRAAVFGMGPHSGQMPISYALWFKTSDYGIRTLLSYEGFWGQDAVMNLRLRDGRPELVYSASQKLFAKDNEVDQFNNGLWHHIAATMPFKGCKISEVKLYVDGEELATSLVGDDTIVNLPNGGMISIGGFGYGDVGNGGNLSREGFRAGLNYVGALDDVMVFARSLSQIEIKEISSRPTSFALRSKLSYDLQEAMCLGFDLFGNGLLLRSCSDGDGQQWIQDVLGYIHNKNRYEECLVPEAQSDGSFAVRVEDCNGATSSTFSWTMEPGFIFHDDSGSLLTVNVDNENAIELSSATGTIIQSWDIVYEGGFAPSYLTGTPSVSPTRIPTSVPTLSPTSNPSSRPSVSPTAKPSASPSEFPTAKPSASPSESPTATPTGTPTSKPSASPSESPTANPTGTPTSEPTRSPSETPTWSPSVSPTSSPSLRPSGTSVNVHLLKPPVSPTILLSQHPSNSSFFHVNSIPDRFAFFCTRSVPVFSSYFKTVSFSDLRTCYDSQPYSLRRQEWES